MFDDETNSPLLIMSFVLHAVSEANLDKGTIKITLSKDICIFIGEKHRSLKAYYCHSRH